MKDTWARDKYWELVGRVQELRGMIRGGLVDMNGPAYIATNPILDRLDKLEAHQHSELVEKPCPTCGRVTLMKKRGKNTVEWGYTLNDYSQSTLSGVPCAPTLYCYGCGKTFTESTRAVLEEVKEGHGDTKDS